MLTPYEGTVELMKARLESGPISISESGAYALAEFMQITYDKLKELYADESHEYSK